MAIKEIFTNPTIKQVIFQMRFPNLFYIENKIGDFQQRIMERFPKSSLVYRRQILFADIGPEAKLESLPMPNKEETGQKMWQFSTADDKVKLNIMSSSLDINSSYHKTYRLGDKDKFRDIIKLVSDNFLDLIPIPTITRLGLRYIDQCPLPSKDNDTFKSYYNSVFPIERFNMADVNEMNFKAVVRRGEYNMMYIESLKEEKGNYSLILDFDGFAADIPSSRCLEVLDSLHDLISEEYEKTIKDPVYEYMRKKDEV